MQIFHHPRSIEYGKPGHPERPERISRTIPRLRANHPAWTWIEATAATEQELLRAHSPAHLALVKNAPQDFDADCPAYPNIYEHAARAAGAAIAAARAAREGELTFSLMRPPGHHASREKPMGFCYFSNIALAALDLIATGTERIAIWDFDAHHGNGTEAIVAGNEKIRFASIHQYPGWPGTGNKSFDNINNFPVAPYSARIDHLREVERAFQILLEFQPQVLLVSAGFDAFVNDPITEMTLEREDFAKFGQWLRETNIPAAGILEGGYSDQLPELVDAFLRAWSPHPK